MLAELYYLIRSQRDGRHLAAHPKPPAKTSRNLGSESSDTGFLLLFKENADALSYLNAHAGELAAHFKVEAIRREQLADLLKRWQFEGVGIVNDPLVPQIEFFFHGK